MPSCADRRSKVGGAYYCKEKDKKGEINSGNVASCLQTDVVWLGSVGD